MRRRARFAALVGLLVLLCAAVPLAGCGSEEAPSSPAPDYAKALAGSPPPLATLHRQGDELLDGGRDAFEARLEELKGYPVVVNLWGSWCGPCIVEFPHFQQAAARKGKEVAFLGVNSADNRDAAETFLRDNPVPYPSYFDQDEEITDSLGGRALPTTVFYNAQGEQTFTKFGPYADTATLVSDIRRYAPAD